MADDLVTHNQYAKRVDVPAELLQRLLDDAVLPAVAKRGPHYTVDPAVLPDGPEIVRMTRDLYRRRLREAIAAVQRLEQEIESVRLDLADALEHGTDPVDALGADVTTVHLTRGPAQQALTDLHFAVLGVQSLHDPLFTHDRARRLTREEP